MLAITHQSSLFSGRHLDLELDGHWGFLLLPPNTPAHQTAGWVWYAPTFSGRPPSSRRIPNPRHDVIAAHLLAHNFAFAGIDVGESHGSPAGRALYTRFHTELTAAFGLAHKVVLFPQSRGGLMHYNWAAEHPDLVARIAGIYTVCNLLAWPGVDKAAPAYDLTPDQLRTQLPLHNPIDRLAPLAAAKVPLFHIHGDHDTVVPLETNAGELVRRYQALDGSAQLLIIPNKGHEEIDEFFTNPSFLNFLTTGPA